MGPWAALIEGSVRPEDADPASWILGIRGMNGLGFGGAVVGPSVCTPLGSPGIEEEPTWEFASEDDIMREATPDSATTDGVYPGAPAASPVLGRNAG